MGCTIVSIVPFPIMNIHKPGLIPPYYNIPRGSEEIPTLVQIGDGKRGQYLVDQEIWQEVQVPAFRIAQSVVYDFINEQICVVVGEAEPGIFFRPGDYSDVEKFKKEFPGDLAQARARQIAWFNRLVSIADDDFKRTGRRTSVTDLQVNAAIALNLNREWIATDPGSLQKCPSCMTLISSGAAVCFACKMIVNAEKYSKFKYATA